MCGILGSIGDSKMTFEIFSSMLSKIANRGPDYSGVEYYYEKNVFLGHNRLSIIDLDSSSNQPFSDESGNYCIVFNGEIYNYKNVREELRKIGCHFSTLSDTEVLLKAYIHWGKECLNKIRGIFSFGIWSKTENSLFIARDQVGVKPLYYSQIGNCFYFSSQVKSLISNINFPKSISLDSFGTYLSLGYIPHDQCIYSAIKKLPAGHFLEFKNSKIFLDKYWNVEYKPKIFDFDEAVFYVSDLLDIVIEEQLVSDVPIGVFLSGGMDSRLLANISARNLPTELGTFTIGFDDPKKDERRLAKEIANGIKSLHFEHVLTQKEALGLMEIFPAIYDEPFYDLSGLPTSFVSKLASANGYKVVLGGDGGDELFAGYPRYLNPSFDTAGRKRKIINSFKNFFIQNVRENKDDVYINRMTFFSNFEINELLGKNEGYTYNDFLFSNLNLEIPGPTKYQLLDFKTYLEGDLLTKVDRASMYHGLEVRVPFLDIRLIELAFMIESRLQIKNNMPKAILKEIYKKRFESPFSQQKRGFSIPLSTWDKSGIFDGFERKILKGRLIDYGVLKADSLIKLFPNITMHQKWILLSGELWAREYLN